jgi:pimeloyl-ACP methyl ester carboxylesterase
MTLAHDRRGTGEPLVMVHGFGVSRSIWSPLVPLLESERELFLIDLPGFGESPPLSERPTPRRLAEAVAAFLDDMGIERAHVAGYSMGGEIVLELNKLGRTLSTCSICPTGFWNRWERAYAKSSLKSTRAGARLWAGALEPLLRYDGLRRALNRQSFEHADRVSAEDTARLMRGFAGAPGFDATIDALHDGRHFTGAREVTPPVTVLWGDRDKLLLPRQAERARDALPQARHLWAPGCNHHPMYDDPEVTARAILTCV